MNAVATAAAAPVGHEPMDREFIDQHQIVERYRNGESVATIAATMDVSPNTVRNRLIDAGERLRARPGWKR